MIPIIILYALYVQFHGEYGPGGGFQAGAIIAAVVRARGGVPRAALAAPWRYLLLGASFGAYFVLMFEGLKTALPVSAAAA